MARDITERYLAEQKLEANLELERLSFMDSLTQYQIDVALMSSYRHCGITMCRKVTTDHHAV